MGSKKANRDLRALRWALVLSNCPRIIEIETDLDNGTVEVLAEICEESEVTRAIDLDSPTFEPLVSKRYSLVKFKNLIAVFGFAAMSPQFASGQTSVHPELAARLRPIGAPSAVDRFASPPPRVFPSSQIQLTQFDFPIGDPVVSGPSLDTSLPPINQPAPSNLPPAAGRQLPRALPVPTPNNGAIGENPLRGNLPSDFTPIAPPQLGNNFATANNSALVVPPSSYNAAMAAPFGGCGPSFAGQPFTGQPFTGQPVVGPAVFGQPTFAPEGFATGNFDPNLTAGPSFVPPAIAPPVSAAPAGALVRLGQQGSTVEVAPGLIGQPKAYVQGQPVRNWLRYFTP